MAVNKVDLYVSQILDDLNNGLTWLKKDDLGYGSVEAKYGANEKQIFAIRKHPALKDAETSITIFNIVDDTKDENKPAILHTKKSESLRSVPTVEQRVVHVGTPSTEVETYEDSGSVHENSDLEAFSSI